MSGEIHTIYRNRIKKISPQLQKDEPPTVNILNGQKYYSFTKRVDGDEGYVRRHITYIRGIRIVFTSPWAETVSEAEESDEFMKKLKIITLH